MSTDKSSMRSTNNKCKYSPLKTSGQSQLRFVRIISLWMSWTLWLIGCGLGNVDTYIPSDYREHPNYDGPVELVYCSLVRSYEGEETLLITGQAQFQKRKLDEDEGLGEPALPLPIRYAEIRVIDSNEDVLQCGQTGENGRFSLRVPKSNRTYNLFVNARADNDHLKISVLDAPERNQLYSLSTSVSMDQEDVDVGVLLAPATGSILGGAFNIYDMVLTANEYLRNTVGTCSVDNCVDFMVAPKLTIYWEKGFNPNSYFNGTAGLSFYAPLKDRLFILGGLNGDTDYQDTDHFDDSVILHEYGHFLEDVFSVTNSPGGEHSGDRLIDPRLALSEGWGNFFQAAVRYNASEGDPRYVDTKGNIDGRSGIIFDIGLEAPSEICKSYPQTTGCDLPQREREGNFREFVITRFFWDVVDSVAADEEVISEGFKEIWAALTEGNGYHNPNVHFRSIGFLHEMQNGLTFNGRNPITDWASLRNQEVHRNFLGRDEYAHYLADGSCDEMNFEMTPEDYLEDSTNGQAIGGQDVLGSGSRDFLKNNDFFHYDHPTEGSFELTLRYQTDANEDKVDLDLYLYNLEARFGVEADIVGYSALEPTEGQDVEEETITIQRLPPGDYLINVNLFLPKNGILGGKTSFELILETDGEEVRLCPTNIP